MAREAKESSVRRTEIIEVAQKAFFERGYAKTSVQNLIDELGIAKGTFYHYFHSKEELLDEVVLAMIDGVLGDMEVKLKSARGTATQRLEIFFHEMAAWKPAHKGFMLELMEVLYRPENLLLRTRVQNQGVAEMFPVIVGIIADGAREGSFDVDDPEEAVEMIMALFTGMGVRLAALMMEGVGDPEVAKRVNRRLEACQEAMNRILGAREKVTFFTSDMMEAWFGS